MPLLLPPTRRQLLFGAAAAALAAPAQAEAVTRWALLSDTHIPADPQNAYRGFRPYENLGKVVPAVQRMQPDGVLIDGDLARLEGLPGDYANLSTLVAPLRESTPLCLALGNHDHRKNFLAAFSPPASERQQVPDKHVVKVERAPVRLVVLDSLMGANQTPGLLGKAQRTWLENFLAAGGNTPTLLFVHHTLDDGDGSLLDADRFLRIVTAARQVKAVFYGHSHRYHYDVLDGLHLINLPAVGYNFNDGEPVGWVEAALSAQGGEFRLRAIGGNTAQDGKLTTLRWR